MNYALIDHFYSKSILCSGKLIMHLSYKSRPNLVSDISFLSYIFFLKILSDHNRVTDLEIRQPIFSAVNKWDQSGGKTWTRKENGSCGGQGCSCKNDGCSFLSRFVAQSHTDAHRRAGSRNLAVGIRSWLSFSMQNFPLERYRSVQRRAQERNEIER